MSASDARFGIAVDSDNGIHVRFRLFAATGGQHPGLCGQIVMRADEFAAFRALLAPRLTDRGDSCTGVTARWCPAHGDCTCSDDSIPERHVTATLDDPQCPLHKPGSDHGEGR
jgi:hypothetical protein